MWQQVTKHLHEGCCAEVLVAGHLADHGKPDAG